MLIELRVLLAMWLFSAIVFMISFGLSTDLFLRNIKTHVSTGGIVYFYREPLFDNIRLTYTEEMVTPEGRHCSAPSNTTTYESTASNLITFKLNEGLLDCLEEGSIYRVSRQFMFFRPSVSETIVEGESSNDFN